MLKSLTLSPIALINGVVRLPGSKSISNRALLLAAMAEGTTRLHNLLDADDTRCMLHALKTLGVECRFFASAAYNACEINGTGGALSANSAPSGSLPLTLFLGNAGTALRPLAAALSLKNNSVILTGETRMTQRPVGHLVDALRQGGAEIDYPGQENYPPLHIAGGFRGGTLTLQGSVSSQFLTALLMAAPLAPLDSDIHIQGSLVSAPYIDITLDLMKTFGIDVIHQDYRVFHLKGRQRYRAPGDYWIEGDASSASYFLAAAAIKGGTVRVMGAGKKSVQGDIHFADALEKMGARISWGSDCIQCSRGELSGIDMDVNHIPDAAMTLATTALFASGPTRLRNIANWRVKETDRLSAMATELRKVGATVEEGEDFIYIIPPKQLIEAKIDTYRDHRLAMCFSLLALSDRAVTIRDPECVAKTFPDYFAQMARLSQAIC